MYLPRSGYSNAIAQVCGRPCRRRSAAESAADVRGFAGTGRPGRDPGAVVVVREDACLERGVAPVEHLPGGGGVPGVAVVPERAEQRVDANPGLVAEQVRQLPAL